MKKRKHLKEKYSIKITTDSNFNDVSVMWISRFDYLKDWKLPLHSHLDYYQMIMITNGSCDVILEDTMHHVDKPCILFLPPHIKHGICNIGNSGLKTLDTKFQINNTNLTTKCKSIKPIQFVFEYDFKGLFESIVVEGQQKKYGYQTYCQLLLGEILIKLIRYSDNNNINSDYMKDKKLFDSEYSSLDLIKIIAFIENNYKKKIYSEDFENNLHFSYRHLSEISKRETGLTPIEMLEQYRIWVAREYLEYSDTEIKQIAEDVGFLGVHQFSRSFKKVMQVSPARFRNEKREGIRQDINIKKDFSNQIFVFFNK